LHLHTLTSTPASLLSRSLTPSLKRFLTPNSHPSPKTQCIHPAMAPRKRKVKELTPTPEPSPKRQKPKSAKDRAADAAAELAVRTAAAVAYVTNYVQKLCAK
jgi:hypothetical protein